MSHGRTALAGALAVLLLSAGCASAPRKRPSPSPAPEKRRSPTPSPVPDRREKRPSPPRGEENWQTGVASWYGEPFHGRRTASGERYDMNEMTAAHRTLPFGTILTVTNLETGDRARVRVNDRGPFIAGRILDCSREAAERLGFRIAGLARVRLDLEGVADSPVDPDEAVRDPEVPLREVHPDAGLFAVQIGAFREEANAHRLRERLEEDFPRVYTVAFREFLRVRVGPYEGAAAAERAAERLQEMGYTPFVTRHDPEIESEELP